ncbi:MAG: 23S rRNA (adenine(2030)-N(6))-methyltransferase RlmJ, partial [Spongiibacteraceae bacterium]
CGIPSTLIWLITMLSYRHGFHAGNHADVLKHLVQVLILDYLLQKDKPITYIDTHAGAGYYALDKGFATQNREFESGIDKLAAVKNLPAPLQRYLAVVAACRGAKANSYPGSPMIAQSLLRRQDHAQLYELHPSEHKLLSSLFKHSAKTQCGDGFAGLKATLPPVNKRGLVLIDPPYEDKGDYQRLLAALKESQKRFANGVYAVWYPLLPRRESTELFNKLKRLSPKSFLHVTLKVSEPEGEFGMYGSAMFVINPPWVLAEQLQEAMPVLAELLSDGDGQNYTIEVVQA